MRLARNDGIATAVRIKFYPRAPSPASLFPSDSVEPGTSSRVRNVPAARSREAVVVPEAFMGVVPQTRPIWPKAGSI